MSATGRGKEREAADFYPTDPRVTLDFLRRVGEDAIPRGVWWEPACGSGAIVRAVDAWRPGGQRWYACDVREESRVECYNAHLGIHSHAVRDFCAGGFEQLAEGPAVIITNPPYNIAEGFAREALRCGRGHATVALLLRVGFLGSVERVAFWRQHPADMYPIVPRPSFGLNKDGKPGTDASEYAWFVWGPQSTGRIHHPDKPWRDRANGQTSMF